MRTGLRIDVDTFRGTRLGVPSLCALLAEHSIKATFFFSVGPDNMGRNLWRLLRPAFLRKMLRTRAGSLYGWDILLRGTFWPGPQIGRRLAPVIRAASDAGHEVGFHAWDHHAWQTGIDRMDAAVIAATMERGVEALAGITGRRPVCSAAPGWRCNDRVLEAETRFGFLYNSDCRGTSIFHPVVEGKRLASPQIPVTMPTYDEAVGQQGVTDADYNNFVLSQIKPDGLNVLCIHAEVEGILHRDMFASFLDKARTGGCSFVPLGSLLENAHPVGSATVLKQTIPGREGWVAVQGEMR